MVMTDPISDMIIRIKNAIQAKHPVVDVPDSKLKNQILKILKGEGYIENFYSVEGEKHGIIRVDLKYNREGEGVIKHLERKSKPGLRIYVKKADIKRVLGGLGITIVSTSKGVMTGEEAKKQNLGGELICEVW